MLSSLSRMLCATLSLTSENSRGSGGIGASASSAGLVVCGAAGAGRAWRRSGRRIAAAGWACQKPPASHIRVQ